MIGLAQVLRPTNVASYVLTLDDTVEFFNLILERQLTQQERQDLVAFLLAL